MQVLRDLYSSKDSAVQLQQQFYSRNQGANETLQEYGLDLMIKIKEVNIEGSLSSADSSKATKLLDEYNDVFSKEDSDLGCCTIGKHCINTEDNIPVKLPDRRVSPLLVPEVQKILKTWLQDGIMKESNSHHSWF